MTIRQNVEKVIAVRIEDANTFIIEKDKQRSSSIKENLQEGEQVYDKEKDKANSNDPNDQMSSTKSNGTHNINLDNSSRSKKSSDVSCKCLII